MFGATEPIKTITVHDADGPHEIEVQQLSEELAAAQQRATWVSGSVVRGEGTAAAATFSRPTTMAVGEEGPSGPTTMAVGEEDSTAPTTMSTGEEDPGPTTMATGEETRIATTLAVGEEEPPITTLTLVKRRRSLRYDSAKKDQRHSRSVKRRAERASNGKLCDAMVEIPDRSAPSANK
jgi:hypothetical protein